MVPTLVDLINGFGPSWGWLFLFLWGAYQFYWPFGETKLQRWHTDFTNRLRQIETGQVSLAEEVDGVDAERYRKIHGQEELSTSDLKVGDD